LSFIFVTTLHALQTSIPTELFAVSSAFGHVPKFLKSNHYLRHVSPSVCQSIRMKQLDSRWADFRRVLYWVGMGVINLIKIFKFC